MDKAGKRRARVLGATGGIRGETAAALLRHGWQVVAMARDPGAGAQRAGPLAEAEWVAGDAMQGADVRRAAEGAEAVVHAVNPPNCRNWGKLVLPMIDNTVAAAKAVGARIVLPGTVYNYGHDAFPVLKEDSPQHPVTEKGRIRVELERRLDTASREGAAALVVRFGDFFGPAPGNNWFSQGLVTPGKRLAAVTYPGAKGVGHAWAYLPDAGEAVARLLDRSGELKPFARFHFGGRVGRGRHRHGAGGGGGREPAGHPGEGDALGAGRAGRAVRGNAAGGLQDALPVAGAGAAGQRQAGGVPGGRTAHAARGGGAADAGGAEGQLRAAQRVGVPGCTSRWAVMPAASLIVPCAADGHPSYAVHAVARLMGFTHPTRSMP